MPDAGYLTIGKVVARLQPKYPDLSVSKVRYLEEEGLLNPSRTPGGYRLYSQHDVRQLETILYLQKTRFMPLQVIKEELQKAEDGRGELMTSATGSPAHASLSDLPAPTIPDEDVDSEEVLNKFHPIDRMPELLGVSVSFVRQLSEAGVITTRRSPRGRDLVDGRDFSLIRACNELSRYGILPKNLRWYVQAANRESGTFQQALTVYGRKAAGEVVQNEEQRAQQDQALSNMLALTDKVRDTLIRRRLKAPAADEHHDERRT